MSYDDHRGTPTRKSIMSVGVKKQRAAFNNYAETNAKFRATENEIANYMALNDNLPNISGARPFKATHGDRYKRSHN